MNARKVDQDADPRVGKPFSDAVVASSPRIIRLIHVLLASKKPSRDGTSMEGMLCYLKLNVFLGNSKNSIREEALRMEKSIAYSMFQV